MRGPIKLATGAAMAAGVLLLTGCDPDGLGGSRDPYGVDWGSYFGSGGSFERGFTNTDLDRGFGDGLDRENRFYPDADREYRGWGPFSRLETPVCDRVSLRAQDEEGPITDRRPPARGEPRWSCRDERGHGDRDYRDERGYGDRGHGISPDRDRGYLGEPEQIPVGR